ncbi:MAG: hypothetical protein ABRQ25_00620 [Clostridiaceae bacterium]
MEKSLKELIVKNSKLDIMVMSLITLNLFIFVSSKVALVYLLGSAVSVINFVVSGYFVSKLLVKNSLFYGIAYALRIFIIALIGLAFAGEFILLSAYIGGYFTHHICLIIYWIFIKKGSE